MSLDCFECGGYSMKRPCPVCDGKCNRIWRRDLTMVSSRAPSGDDLSD